MPIWHKNCQFLGYSTLENTTSGNITMTSIVLNGETRQIDDNCSIEQLLKSLDLENKRLAVEINQTIIPRSHFSDHILNDSDRVEIVQAIGGG
jgi:sulfur carrier protein